MVDSPQPEAPAEKAAAQQVEAPTVTFKSLKFSDGTLITLDETDIVVLVGPNNAGKSAALRELEAHIGPQRRQTVITDVELRHTGTGQQLVDYLEQKSRKRRHANNLDYLGFRFSLRADHVANWFTSNLDQLRPFFCLRVPTESRINDSNPASAIPILDEPPSHPIHLLYADDAIEQKISGYFQRAFDQELIVFRAGGSQWPLLTGRRPQLLHGETIYGARYNERLRTSTIPLQSQGDGMRSFASVILHLLTPNTPSVLLLDEPEAFLHPPQARLLGEFIAKERPKNTQLFIATHSADVLQGLFNVASDKLRVLRVQRQGSVNRVKELDKTRTEAIGADPLMKFSNVLSGIFYQRVVIAESDADCLFYSAVLDLPQVHGTLQPDVLFIHAGGKHRMAALAEALRALDVTVDVVTDMDVLKEDSVLERIVLSLGGDWPLVQAQVAPLRKAIEQHKPWLNAEEVAKGIGEIIAKVPSTGEFPSNLKGEVDAIFRKASPWDAVKDAGEAAIPAGQPTMQYRTLQDQCKKCGLWIVPVGELEGFCKEIGGHGPRWVQKILETKDLAHSDELKRARDFVQEIWNSA
jgi:AAA domain, putative AbiEii toxin, Type IV TA system